MFEKQKNKKLKNKCIQKYIIAKKKMIKLIKKIRKKTN